MIREKNLMECPIDNKNLMEDPFTEEVFCDGFMAARDHYKNGLRHLIGKVVIYDDECPNLVNSCGYVDVLWHFGGNTVMIKVIAVDAGEDFDVTRDEIFNHYEQLFKSWECESNPNLVVRVGSENDALYVHFYWGAD